MFGLLGQDEELETSKEHQSAPQEAELDAYQWLMACASAVKRTRSSIFHPHKDMTESYRSSRFNLKGNSIAS
jgi:hypothetical protein